MTWSQPLCEPAMVHKSPSSERTFRIAAQFGTGSDTRRGGVWL